MEYIFFCLGDNYPSIIPGFNPIEGRKIKVYLQEVKLESPGQEGAEQVATRGTLGGNNKARRRQQSTQTKW